MVTIMGREGISRSVISTVQITSIVCSGAHRLSKSKEDTTVALCAMLLSHCWVFPSVYFHIFSRTHLFFLDRDGKTKNETS